MTVDPEDEQAVRRRWRREEAQTRLRTAGTWGIGLYVVGVIIWVVSARASDDVDSGGGAAIGLVVGGLTASVGAAMVLVFLIGWGVKLGREAADV